MPWTTHPRLGGPPPAPTQLPDIAAVQAVLTERQAQLWQAAVGAMNDALDARRAAGRAGAAIDAARHADTDEGHRAVRAGRAIPTAHHEAQARTDADAARRRAEATAQVAFELCAELEHALTSDQAGLARRAIDNLRVVVESGGWQEIVTAAELAGWVRDIDETPLWRRHPQRADLARAADLLSTGPHLLAAEAAANLSWLTDPPDRDAPASSDAPATIVARAGSVVAL